MTTEIQPGLPRFEVTEMSKAKALLDQLDG